MMWASCFSDETCPIFLTIVAKVLHHPLAFEAYRQPFYKAPLEYDEGYSGD